MDDLIAFVTARLDEARQRAEKMRHAFVDEPFYDCPATRTEPLGDLPWGEDACTCGLAGRKARALREVGARRAILGMHHPTEPHPEFGFTYPAAARFCGWCGPGDNWQAEQEPDMFPFAVWPCRHARILAAVDSDHPGYRPGWKL